MKQAYGDEDGVVLLLVLVVIVLTIISVYAFARTAVLDVVGLRQSADRDRAEVLARSGLELAYRALADDVQAGDKESLSSQLETRRDAWALLEEADIPVPGDGRLRVLVRDTGSRFGLNSLIDTEGALLPESRAFMVAALERIIENMPGRPEEKPYEPEDLADAILDWIDSDDTSRMGDDEESTYQRLRATGRPLDRPIFMLRELAGLPDMDEALLAELEHYFTPYPLFPILGGGGVNPNTAPPHVLGLIYYGTEDDRRLADKEDVFRILHAREEGRVFCGTAVGQQCVTFASEIGRAGETVFPRLTLAAEVFMIESRATVGTARVRIAAVVNRGKGGKPRLLEYRFE
jgi:type II secretory pathway component PulK